MVGQQGKVPGDAVVQLLVAQGGFQVDLGVVAVLFHVPQVAGGAEGQRPADAEVSEQHLALLVPHRPAVLEQGQLDVFQGQAHHLFAVRIVGHQADQAGHRLDDGVAGLPGQLVAVAGGAGDRVAQTPGGHQDAVRPVVFARGPPDPHAAEGGAFLRLFAFGRHRCGQRLQQKARRPVINDLCAAGVGQKGLPHLSRLVRHREHPAAPLGLEGHPQRRKQLHGPGRREGIQRRIQKPGVGADVPQKFFLVAGVGQIAAALASDQDLLGRFFGVFQHRNGVAAPHGGAGSHQAGCARPHDQYIRHGQVPLFVRIRTF